MSSIFIYKKLQNKKFTIKGKIKKNGTKYFLNLKYITWLHSIQILIVIVDNLKIKKLKIEFMGRGSAWLDTGNAESLFETSQFISNIEKRQGLKIACLEEIALNNKWISKSIIKKQINFYGNCDYSNYLKKLI